MIFFKRDFLRHIFQRESIIRRFSQRPMAKSFVFIDLETHDLTRPKITEICLVAVSRRHILDANKKKEFIAPRILNKLTLCVNPQTIISPQAAFITGLSNELLEDCPAFNVQTATIIQNFLVALPQPVCMIAHNGFKFDFPALKATLQNLNQSLPDHILCSDTLPGFRSVFKAWISAAESANKVKASTSKSTEEWLNDGNDAYFLNVDCERLTAEADAYDLFSQAVNESEADLNLQQNCSQLSWDVPCCETPKRSRVENGKKSPNITYVDVETNAVINGNSAGEPAPAGSAKAHLTSTPVVVRKDLYPFTAPASYCLKDVYIKLRGSEPIGHRAEADVLSMLECVLVIGPEILQYFDDNSTLFKDIEVSDRMRP